MQEKYIKLDFPEALNGQYMLTVFKVSTYGGISILDAATEIAAESSNGSNISDIKTDTLFSDAMGAVVYKVDEEKGLIWLAYPWRMFDRGGNVQNIITFINGNILGIGSISGCKLLDLWFPTEMLTQYNGPTTTLDDMREYLGNYSKPILGTIIKPKIGLTANEYAEVCYDFWAGGGDFVKNDEPQADQDFCPYKDMVRYVREAMDRAEQETGQAKVHSFNVSAADFNTMIERADLVVKTMKPGSYSLLVDGITAGWTAIQTIQRSYPNAFVHFHRAGHGAFTRDENPFGMTVPAMTKLGRLAGASGMHTGTANIGKMAATAEETQLASEHALRLKSKGPFFDQVWSAIPEKDEDIKAAVAEEQAWWDMGPLAQAKERAKQETQQKVNNGEITWRGVKKMAPICSGGMNPVLLAPYIETIGTIDFIITMGAGVHAHPERTKAGIKAVVQAYDAWFQGVDVHEYAKDFHELQVAVEYYDKEGTQAHRIDANTPVQ